MCDALADAPVDAPPDTSGGTGGVDCGNGVVCGPGTLCLLGRQRTRRQLRRASGKLCVLEHPLRRAEPAPPGQLCEGNTANPICYGGKTCSFLVYKHYKSCG